MAGGAARGAVVGLDHIGAAMTPAGMAALRVGATLAHALPGVRLRLRCPGGHTLLEVAGGSERHPAGDGRSLRVVPPCAFRSAVGRAQERMAAGVRIAFLGLPLGNDPAVDVGVPPGGRALGAGLVAVPIPSVGCVQAFATTLPPETCRRLVTTVAHPAASATVRVTRDETTDVTLVHASVPPRDAVDRPSPVLEEALSLVAAEELVRQLPSSARNG